MHAVKISIWKFYSEIYQNTTVFVIHFPLIYLTTNTIIKCISGTENTVYVKKGNETFLGIDQDNTTAKWTHNGRPLTTNGMRRTRINIQNALPNNTGLYVCTLSQSEKSFKHQLIVIGK